MRLSFFYKTHFCTGSCTGTVLATFILLVLVWSYPLPAKAADAERDPFFTAGPRSDAKTAVEKDADWGRDPFNRPFIGTAQSAAPSAGRGRGGGLTGIISSGAVRLAIINGEAYKEGSMIGEQKLTSIRNRSVVLVNRAGNREEMFLEDFSFRK